MTAIPRMSLVRMEQTTGFAPLAVLGAYIRERDLLSPLFTRMEFRQRMHTEKPGEAMVDLWVSMLAGCRSIHQVNTKIRPDLLLAKAWGRERFCEQSTLARVLDACEEEQVRQLRAGVEALYRWIGQAPQGTWDRCPLMIDIDLTGLPAGRNAEGSTKGYFSEKKGVRGRQLCRIGATDYDESVSSLLYPGNQLSQHVLLDAVESLERVLGLRPEHRQQICLRVDAGFGTDHNLNWVLRQGYQLCAKNNSGRRAGAWGAQVQEWQVVEPDHRWVALSPQQLHFCVPTRTLALRWLDHRKNKYKHALFVVTDLDTSPLEICHLYDLRGAAEIEIRNDKQGLLLTHRRKRLWHAQEILILLNDLAHNFLSMFRATALVQTPLANFGPSRLIQEVLNIPGELIFEGDRLSEIRFSQDHPYSKILLEALPRLWQLGC